jgi:hypothetical protein
MSEEDKEYHLKKTANPNFPHPSEEEKAARAKNRPKFKIFKERNVTFSEVADFLSKQK